MMEVRDALMMMMSLIDDDSGCVNAFYVHPYIRFYDHDDLKFEAMR